MSTRATLDSCSTWRLDLLHCFGWVEFLSWSGTFALSMRIRCFVTSLLKLLGHNSTWDGWRWLVELDFDHLLRWWGRFISTQSWSSESLLTNRLVWATRRWRSMHLSCVLALWGDISGRLPCIVAAFASSFWFVALFWDVIASFLLLLGELLGLIDVWDETCTIGLSRDGSSNATVGDRVAEQRCANNWSQSDDRLCRTNPLFLATLFCFDFFRFTFLNELWRMKANFFELYKSNRILDFDLCASFR